ncbi:cupredoxin domain-containing protein [Conexibacter sp. JD483]|uniref:cupredoxin domain-containing protein n=1 Tax=unclassified Conexibacter TaxID=2627773 RepID=UPI00271E535B|nr:MULTISPECIES: cupredoxin domain-containing protein [unclassified Conexibacter]MDO8188141.1 cupredoxin domain-containing protein [Conexibacter sp. CPCC 205706]MDO8201295.1 cupredoxin domain-containing protein [Conexibacter sp. CPCC 205762]MDR9370433.1 cupredoxin domain-containing protein [Conexibacter sp. JD483]
MSAAAALALAACALAGCGSSGGSSSTAAATTSTGVAPTTAEAVTIASFKYRPVAVSVRVGARLRFDNRDDAAHTATADDGSFDSGTIAVGATRQVTFSRAGTFAYHCDFHPFMHGTVLVR